MKVAIVHDWLTNLGGAERVVAVLARMFPDAPIYTSVYSAKQLEMFENSRVITSFLQHWPLAKRKHQLYPVLRTLAFESFDFSEYDLVISSSSAEAKGIVTGTETIHISYIHTPTRYYWSGYEQYLQDPGFGRLNFMARMGLKRLVKTMRRWDYAAAQRPDVMIANSATVQARIHRYYDRDSRIIHPPVDTARFGIGGESEDYYLAVGRLVAYKRFDLLVKACTNMNRKLIVAGNGPELAHLRSVAGPCVDFRPNVSDSEVTDLMRGAKAFLFASEEDFGITPVEAMAAGKPVVAFKKGGATETVKEGVSGVFFDSQSVESVESAISSLEQKATANTWSSHKIRREAEKFSEAVFEAAIREAITDAFKARE